MAIYYIRRPENEELGRELLINGLIDVYDLVFSPATVIVVSKKDEAKLDPILSELAEFVVREGVIASSGKERRRSENERARNDGMAGESTVEKGKRGHKGQVMPKALCPECGRMQAMTKRGYCKLCAMKYAREKRASAREEQASAREEQASAREEKHLTAESAESTEKTEMQGAEVKSAVLFDHNQASFQDSLLTRKGPIKAHRLG